MRRTLLVLAFALALPSPAAAQPRLLLGGGFSAPNGDFSDIAEAGYNLQAGLEIDLPNLPVALRGDGNLHKFPAKDPSFTENQVLAGALSLVFRLPGIGLQPYFLGGIGSYRTESGLVGEKVRVTDTGYHGGFGVALGGPGFSAYVELRFIYIDAAASTRIIPLTLGLRL